MGKAIVAGIVIIVIVLVAVGYFIWSGRLQAKQENLRAGRAIKGDLNRGAEQALVGKLDDAANLMRSMLASAGQLDGDFLTLQTRTTTQEWLNSYSALRKEIERV